uniref:Glutamate decarboxylase n=1 Tax=Glossina brevipalpis TaxID=37001 RepID=A0A1A9WSM0_9MUSC
MNSDQICNQSNGNEQQQQQQQQQQQMYNSPTDLINSVDSIRLKLTDDWKLLSSIYDLLVDEKAFCTASHEWNEKIVQFEQPKELKKLIDLKIDENKSLTMPEIEKICRQIIKYSISELCGYVHGDGIFSPGGSISNMYGLVLARYRRHPNIKTGGMFGLPPLVLFTSQESHYSLKKAAHWLGFGMNNCIEVATNERGQMSIEDLESKILDIKAEGRVPFFVNATAGTTVLGAFDDFEKVANICEKYNLWLHVDACLGGSALFCYKYRQLLKGLHRSNSFSWNPHKSMGAPLQCSLFITRELELLPQCNSLAVDYLFQQDKFYDISYDTGNKSIQCGRKVDAFKLWLMLKARGYGSFGHLLDYALDISKIFVNKLKQRKDHGFRLVLDEFQYTNVCFWYIPKHLRNLEETEEWNNQLYEVAPKVKELMIREGTLMLGYCPLQYRNVGNFFRMVFTCFPIINDSELDFILDEIERLAEQCHKHTSNGFV